MLNQFDVKDIKRNQPKNIVFYYYLDSLNHIFLGKTDQIETNLKKMSSQIFKIDKDKRRATFQIEVVKVADDVIGKRKVADLCPQTDYVESHLDRLITLFLKGMDLRNQARTAEAEKYFQEIADENPELFYVREARRFLEE